MFVEVDCGDDRMTNPPDRFDQSMADIDWIALESISEGARRFIFRDAVLDSLSIRGFIAFEGLKWSVSPQGHRALLGRDKQPCTSAAPPAG